MGEKYEDKYEPTTEERLENELNQRMIDEGLVPSEIFEILSNWRRACRRKENG